MDNWNRLEAPTQQLLPLTNMSYLHEDWQHGAWRPGVRMTHEGKVTMANRLVDILSLTTAQFERFYEPVAFETGEQRPSRTRFDANYAALLTQLASYQRVYEDTSGRTAAPKRVRCSPPSRALPLWAPL